MKSVSEKKIEYHFFSLKTLKTANDVKKLHLVCRGFNDIFYSIYVSLKRLRKGELIHLHK